MWHQTAWKDTWFFKKFQRGGGPVRTINFQKLSKGRRQTPLPSDPSPMWAILFLVPKNMYLNTNFTSKDSICGTRFHVRTPIFSKIFKGLEGDTFPYPPPPNPGILFFQFLKVGKNLITNFTSKGSIWGTRLHVRTTSFSKISCREGGIP